MTHYAIHSPQYKVNQNILLPASTHDETQETDWLTCSNSSVIVFGSSWRWNHIMYLVWKRQDFNLRARAAMNCAFVPCKSKKNEQLKSSVQILMITQCNGHQNAEWTWLRWLEVSNLWLYMVAEQLKVINASTQCKQFMIIIMLRTRKDRNTIRSPPEARSGTSTCFYPRRGYTRGSDRDGA